MYPYRPDMLCVYLIAWNNSIYLSIHCGVQFQGIYAYNVAFLTRYYLILVGQYSDQDKTVTRRYK